VYVKDYGTIHDYKVSMDTIIARLQSLKADLPMTSSVSNLSKLRSRFLEYKYIVSSLPENYQKVKNKCENNFDILKLKIDAIEDNLNAPKAARFYFNAAIQYMRTEIDNIMVAINNEPGSGKQVG
jgi:hypothetical protein